MDGSDAIADWPLLNAMLNTACGASWVSLHHGGGVGIGYSIHAGMVAVADGTEMADRRLRAGAHRRSRHRRHAPRRRRVSDCHRDGQGARGRPPDDQRRSERSVPVLRNIGLLATCRPDGGPGRPPPHPECGGRVGGGNDPLGRARVGAAGGIRRWRTDGARGRLVVPGLVDCHTHLAFGGWRADEFEQRIQGRRLPRDRPRRRRHHVHGARDPRLPRRQELVAKASAALEGMRRLGVTTVECKSGYGLDLDTELRLLRVYRTLRRLATDPDRPHLSRRACRADRISRRPGGYLRPAARRDDPGSRRRRAGAVLRCVCGGHGLQRRRGAADLPRREGRRARPEAARRPAHRRRRRGAGRGGGRRSAPITWSAPRMPALPRWPRPAWWR